MKIERNEKRSVSKDAKHALMNITKPADLKPDLQNARRHPERNKAMIRQSLEEIGGFRSIGVDGENIIRAGNGVYEQAQELGLKIRVIDAEPDELIAVRRADLKGKRAVRAALLDNRTNETSEWDMDALSALDKEFLKGLWEPKEFEALFQDNGSVPEEIQDPEPQIDRAEQLQEKWDTKTGQLWLIPSKTVPGKAHRLLCGDSTKAEDVARVMGGEKARLFATDPPYGVNYVKTKSGIPRPGYATLDRDYDHIDADNLQDAALQNFLESVFRVWCAHLDLAAWYLWHAHLTQGFFAAAAAAAADVLIHRQIIWVKSGFNLTRSGMYHWAHEPCFFGWVRGKQCPWYGEKNQRSVWNIDRHKDKGIHPTEKPADLWVAPMKNHTLLGEICAEPFAGSGSQFVAAEQLGRLCYGIEIESKYIAVTLERLAALELQPRFER